MLGRELRECQRFPWVGLDSFFFCVLPMRPILFSGTGSCFPPFQTLHDISKIQEGDFFEIPVKILHSKQALNLLASSRVFVRETSVTGAVHWWEEWQLRVLVLCSLAIQCLLFLFSFMRRYAIPGSVRFMMWLAYLAGDAVAIYALATLFNRHKTDEHGGSTLEVVWAPVLLHLGGHDGFTAYNIEDNELWSRHLLTAVSQVTVAIYVFCKSWPPGGDKRLLQSAILLFVNGVLKCFVKPWALKSASIYSLVSSPAASVKQNEGEMYLLENYVRQAKVFVQKQNDEGEAQVARASVDDEDRPRCNKEPGGTAIDTVTGALMEDVRGAWVALGRVKGKLVGAWVFVRGLLKADERASSQGSFFGRLREGLRQMLREMSREQSRNYQVNERVREMLEGRSEASKLFVDLSSSYPRRLSILEDFWGLREERAYVCVRQGLATAFLLLYTKLKTAVKFGNGDMGDHEESLGYLLRMLIQLSRMLLPWASIGLFHRSNREAYDGIDVKITYAIFCCTAVLETYSSFSLVLTGETGEEWPEMVAQYSFIGYSARNMKHSKMMRIVSLLGCKDFLDQHWCMKSCFSSARISELVLRYLKDGWRKKIEDAASYRSFNDHRSSKGLRLSTNRNRPLLFDESVLLWHIATDFCFFSSSFSEHRCAFAKVPMWTERLPALASHPLQGKQRLPALVCQYLGLLIHGRIKRIRETVLKCICRTSLPVKNGQTTSQCGQEFTRCKAVLCTQMSNYMAYLLFVNPEMLLPGSRRNLFTAAHQELQAIFKGDNQAPLPLDNKRELTQKIISKLNSSSEATTSAPFIYEAWMLAQELQSSGDEKKMWEDIQDVWVQMLCFSASRCRGYLHAKALGKGGEFLSYVWLLLFHMGMETFTDKLQREDLPSQEAGNNAATAPPSTSERVSSTTGAGAAPSTSSGVHTASASAGAAPSTSEICMAE